MMSQARRQNRSLESSLGTFGLGSGSTRHHTTKGNYDSTGINRDTLLHMLTTNEGEPGARAFDTFSQIRTRRYRGRGREL